MPSDAENPLDTFFRNTVVPSASEVRLVAKDTAAQEEWNTCERLAGGPGPDDPWYHPTDLLFRALLNGREGFLDALNSDIPPEQLLPLFGQLGPAAKEAIMTTAELLRTEGRAQLLSELLTARFGPLSVGVERKIREAGPERVTAWAVRFATATSLDEVLADANPPR